MIIIDKKIINYFNLMLLEWINSNKTLSEDNLK